MQQGTDATTISTARLAAFSGEATQLAMQPESDGNKATAERVQSASRLLHAPTYTDVAPVLCMSKAAAFAVAGCGA